MGSTNLPITVDFRSDAPIYAQIIEQIRQKVASGELKQGDQLPTVRQLATDLRVNWNTVARAYRVLDAAGLISTQQGRGTFIWDTPDEETTHILQKEALQGLTRRYFEECARLGCTPEEIEQFVLQGLKEWYAFPPLPEPKSKD